MPVDARENLRRISSIAFGQRYRLEVMCAIADSSDGLVCLTDLSRELGISASNVQGPLNALLGVGLLARLPSGDTRRRYYIRNESAAWAWARELAERCQMDIAELR